MIKKVVIAVLLGVFLFFQIKTLISKPTHDVDPSIDFFTTVNPSDEISQILRSACTDCHSNEVNYRWYNYVGGVGNWIDGHIKHGTQNLNFSKWGAYDEGRRSHKAEEIVEEVRDGNMPLKSYTWTHKNAKLTPAQQRVLIDYFNRLAH